LRTECFFNSFEVKDEQNNIILIVDTEDKSEFAEIISVKSPYQIKIPKDGKIIDKVLRRYKEYCLQLKESLEQNAYEKLHNWAIAEKITKEIMEEWGLDNS
jgi:hypothetical protein